MTIRCAAILAIALVTAGCRSAPWIAIDVHTSRVEIGAATVGALTFRGGIELFSADSSFGELSDLEVGNDERVLAITDAGMWVDGRIELDAEGRLIGLSAVRLAPLRDEHGAPLEGEDARDAEGLARLGDGRVAVSFERSQSIRIYGRAGWGPWGGAFGAGTDGPRLAGTSELGANRGLEALAPAGGGRLLVGAEEGRTEGTAVWIATLDASAAAAPAARYPLDEGFGLVDFDVLPGGDFVALERAYSPNIGNRIRVTTLSPASLTAGDHIVRPVRLAELARPLLVDNFEGISAVARPDGGVRLYLVSDNNQSADQRTLLYAFDVAEDARVDVGRQKGP